MIYPVKRGTGTFSNDERSGFLCEGFEDPLKIADAAAGDGLGGRVELKLPALKGGASR